MPRSVGSEGIAGVRQALEGSASDSSHQQHSPSAECRCLHRAQSAGRTLAAAPQASLGIRSSRVPRSP